MKKSLFSFKNKILFLFFLGLIAPFCVNSQSLEGVNVTSNSETVEMQNLVPILLEGIWENRTRTVIFDSGYVTRLSSRRIPAIALKPFYGWYMDRTAESDEFSFSNPRPSNDATSKNAQQLEIRFEPLVQELYSNDEASVSSALKVSKGNEASGAWIMEIKYPGIKEKYYIPVAVIGNKLYLDFLIRPLDDSTLILIQGQSSEDSPSKDSLLGFWQDTGASSGIMVSPPLLAKELLSYYVNAEYAYHIRYWETDMDYDGVTEAAFSDDNKTFYVPKHLLSGNRVFTCVAGRSRNIRNIERSKEIPEKYELNEVNVSGYVSDENGNNVYVDLTCATIMGLGEPYLIRLDDSLTYEDILSEAALRKAPSPAPLFPPHGLLDFDWSIIEDPPESYDRRMLDLGK